jgi:hypothetical protein
MQVPRQLPCAALRRVTATAAQAMIDMMSGAAGVPPPSPHMHTSSPCQPRCMLRVM